MRLERYISQSISRSRRDVRRLIQQGRVRVNDEVEREHGRQVVQHHDAVTLDGQPLDGPGGHRLLMMHKPKGCVTANKSDMHQTVMDHMPVEHQHADLFPIGRLDKDTTGLLLFATDGGLNQLILHPRRHVEKAYIADLKAPMPADAEAVFAAGVELSDGSVCLPATLERLTETRVRVVLTEGRFHQVKRMIGHTGGHVTALHRERIGPIVLDPALAVGEVRALTVEERTRLVAAVRDNAKDSGVARVRGKPRRTRRGGLAIQDAAESAGGERVLRRRPPKP